MTAGVRIYELTASKAGTDKTGGTVRFKDAHDQTVNSNNPLTIPSSGTNYSFTKQLRMYCATAPGTKIDNFRAYPDAANNFGASIAVVASVIDDFHTATRTALSASDLWDFSSGHAMDLDQFHATSCTGTGFFGDIVKLQMSVKASASSGTLSAEDLTFAYDEI